MGQTDERKKESRNATRRVELQPSSFSISPLSLRFDSYQRRPMPSFFPVPDQFFFSLTNQTKPCFLLPFCHSESSARELDPFLPLSSKLSPSFQCFLFLFFFSFRQLSSHPPPPSSPLHHRLRPPPPSWLEHLRFPNTSFTRQSARSLLPLEEEVREQEG